MTGDLALDIARDAVRLTLVLSGPLLGVALVVGLVSGLLQTATQVHEHTLSFVPKLAGVALVLAVALPWLLVRWMEYAVALIGTICQRL